LSEVTNRERVKTLVRARVALATEAITAFHRQVAVSPSAAIVLHGEAAMQAQYFVHEARDVLELVASAATLNEVRRGIEQLKTALTIELIGTGASGPGPWTPMSTSLVVTAKRICECNARRDLVRLYSGALRLLQDENWSEPPA
jgi:hypothetical protein